MPLYEYQCPQCGRFERIRKFSDAPLTTCPTCGQQVQKLLSAPAIQFKGSGWYVTDYARKGSNGDGGKRESTSESKPAGGDKGSSSTPEASSSKSSPATSGAPTK